MKEAIAVILIISIFFCLSFIAYRYILRVKLLNSIIISFVYLIVSKYYFDVINYTQNTLRSKGIFFNFGHADLGLLEEE